MFGCALAFYIIALYINNPYIIYFISYILNGWVILVHITLTISLSMQYFDREYRNVGLWEYIPKHSLH